MLLQVLSLAHCPMVTLLSGVADSLSLLRELDVSDTGIGDPDLCLLAASCPLLRWRPMCSV